MDFLISISQALFKPEIFWIFLTGSVILSSLTIFIYILQSERQTKLLEGDKIKLGQYWERQVSDYQNKNAELSKSLDVIKVQLETQSKEKLSIDKLKEELKKKEEALYNEILTKEKFWIELKHTESQLVNIKNKLESKEKELAVIDDLKKELKKKEEEFKNVEVLLPEVQVELESSQEVYSGLKEQYEELERQVDVLNQELSIEKTLHQRLKEEHSNCRKPVSSQENLLRL